jgi:hypothetical protein
VNWLHLRAFLWLRWRLRMNQWRRAGTVNAVILTILAVAALLLALVLFVSAFVVGLLVLPDAPPAVLMYLWDGLVVAFLFFWAAGLLTDLQRAEVLSLDKFLHLPVSLTGAFLINYLSSLLSLGLILFLPAMVGLSLGLVFGKGPVMLLVLPLVASFLLMVTALTYQFQGWLAAMMSNPRRRRTVIVVMTMAFVLIFQLPNLLNVYSPWRKDLDQLRRSSEEREELERSYGSGQITAAEYEQRRKEYDDKIFSEGQELKKSNQQRWQHMEQTIRLVNMILPPGWLPLGAFAAAESNVLPALLGTLGLSFIGTISLWRAHRTTVRLYTGQFTARTSHPHAAVAQAPTAMAPANLLQKDVPGLSEQASAIALASFRSLMRAPEAKMMLLTPVILTVVFASMFFARSVSPPEFLRPLMALGAAAMVLVTTVQIAGNQFGFDRSGFRVFVLCGVPRREILLGKNAALAPVALGLSLAMLVLLQVMFPMRLELFVSAVPLMLSMYLVFCLLANWLSIFGPMAIAPGSLKPASAKLVPVLLQMVFFFLFPLALGPILLPVVVVMGLEALGWASGIPVCLILSLLETVVVTFLYRVLLTGQGRLLQVREQRILEVVTSKAE